MYSIDYPETNVASEAVATTEGLRPADSAGLALSAVYVIVHGVGECASRGSSDLSLVGRYHFSSDCYFLVWSK